MTVSGGGGGGGGAQEAGCSNDNPVLYELTEDGIAIITFNRPKKLNGWSAAVIAGFQAGLRRANDDPACRAAVMTGRGRYFSSGADFGGQLGPMLPSALVKFAEEYNYGIFEAFIAFDKPLVVAAQGPAVGGAVTSACSLSDYVVCGAASTWHTPFVDLGITAEGCAEYTFPLRLRDGAAAALLKEGRKVTAAEALEMGLVNEVVDADAAAVLQRGLAVARALCASGGRRWEIVPGFRGELERLGRTAFVAKLRAVNRAESARLGQAIIGKPFFRAQMRFAERKGNTKLAWAFWAMGALQPLLSRL